MYADIIGGIRAFASELVICVSLSGRNWEDLGKTDGGPRTNWRSQTGYGQLDAFVDKLQRGGEAQDHRDGNQDGRTYAGDQRSPGARGVRSRPVNYANFLADRGALQPPHNLNLLLGNVATAQADPLHIGSMIRDLPEDSLWASPVSAIPRYRCTVSPSHRGCRRG